MFPEYKWKIKPMSEYLIELESLPELQPLWGPVLYPSSVTLVIGESSIGKTVLIYRLCQALVRGEEFLGLTPPRPLKVLHIDLETPPLLQRKHLRVITPPAGWDLWDGPFTLKDLPEGYDVVIIDSLMLASPVTDENDNSQANAQLMPYLAAAKKTKSAIVLVHNSGKSSQKEKFYSRGASSRIDRVDVGVNVTNIIGGRRIKIVKTRYEALEQYIDYAFIEELSYRVTHPLGGATGESNLSKTETSIKAVLSDTVPTTIQFLFDILQASTENLRRQVERALTNLVKKGEVRRQERGHYLLCRKDK